MTEILNAITAAVLFGVISGSARLMLIALAVVGIIGAIVLLTDIWVERMVSAPDTSPFYASYNCACGCSGISESVSRLVRCDNCLRLVTYHVIPPIRVEEA
tara:strand:- start:343 stop:645 length:303 start_codon:yes stop_codon:yes gene_type:complete